MHAIRCPPAAAAAAGERKEGGAQLTLQLWSGSLSAGFKVVSLRFDSSTVHAAWRMELCNILHCQLRRAAPLIPLRVQSVGDKSAEADSQMPSSAHDATHECVRRIFDLHDTSRSGRLTLHQASDALTALGQPVLPTVLPTLIEHLSPFESATSVDTLNLTEFERLVTWVKASLLTAHVAQAEAFADLADDAQLISKARFAAFWSINQHGRAYPPQQVAHTSASAGSDAQS